MFRKKVCEMNGISIQGIHQRAELMMQEIRVTWRNSHHFGFF